MVNSSPERRRDSLQAPAVVRADDRVREDVDLFRPLSHRRQTEASLALYLGDEQVRAQQARDTCIVLVGIGGGRGSRQRVSQPVGRQARVLQRLFGRLADVQVFDWQ